MEITLPRRGRVWHDTFQVKLPARAEVIAKIVAQKGRRIARVSLSEPVILDKNGKPTKYVLSPIASLQSCYPETYIYLPSLALWSKIKLRLVNETGFNAHTLVTVICIDEDYIPSQLHAFLPPEDAEFCITLPFIFDLKRNGIRKCKFYGTSICKVCSRLHSCEYKKIKELEEEVM